MIYELYAKNIYESTQIPTRLLKGNKTLFLFSNVESEILQNRFPLLTKNAFDFKSKKAAIAITHNHLYFAKILIKDTPYSLEIGPCFNIYPSDEIKKSILSDLNLTQKEEVYLDEILSAVPETELRVFLNFVILFDLLINNENIDRIDLLLSKEIPEFKLKSSPKKRREEASFAEREEAEKLANLVAFYIKNGMYEKIESMYDQTETSYVGKMAQDSVRQSRNTFIVAATLYSRSAIKGGLSPVTALSTTDLYIQKAEMLSDYYAISALQSEMIINLAKAVAEIKTKGSSGSFVSSIRSYVFNHINEKIYLSDMANELFVNKSYLTTKFKAITGKTVIEYVTELKIDEAKRLLKTTDKTLSQISEQLAFSSQSYFQNVFKKETNMTPQEFRNQN